jgi:SAM-dependent methyltransferase
MLDRSSAGQRHPEWHYQWSHFQDQEDFLFRDWIWPRTLEDLRGCRVLDVGCGSGQHVSLVAGYAREVVGLDLNTAELARQRTRHLPNVTIVQGDAGTYRPDRPFDVVYCIGVIHHTDDPDLVFRNLQDCCRPGGLLIVWCYSREGNALVRALVEPLRATLLARLPRPLVRAVAVPLTALLYFPVFTLYRLPLRRLPFYEYFRNFRRLSFARNLLNTFDKLNAPQTQFIDRERVARWFRPSDFTDISITPYGGVSWRASGRLR